MDIDPLIFQIENMGDPWHGFSNGPGMTFWDSVYYLLVTMSTVGYGDISCKTDIGKFFILIFIVGSFVSMKLYLISMSNFLVCWKDSSLMGYLFVIYFLLLYSFYSSHFFDQYSVREML